MERYVIKSVKYLVWLSLLFAFVFGAMILTGTSRLSPQESLDQLFGSTRGAIMIVVILILAAFYPKFGFTKRRINGNIVKDRLNIVEAFHLCGYSLSEQNGDQMIFRASTPLKRVFLMWEDKIVVKQVTDTEIEMEGIRKEVVKAGFRVQTYIGREDE